MNYYLSLNQWAPKQLRKGRPWRRKEDADFILASYRLGIKIADIAFHMEHTGLEQLELEQYSSPSGDPWRRGLQRENYRLVQSCLEEHGFMIVILPPEEEEEEDTAGICVIIQARSSRGYRMIAEQQAAVFPLFFFLSNMKTRAAGPIQKQQP